MSALLARPLSSAARCSRPAVAPFSTSSFLRRGSPPRCLARLPFVPPPYIHFGETGTPPQYVLIFTFAVFHPSVAATADTGSYQDIIASTKGKVGIIQLNRPKALNALSSALFHEVNDALSKYESDPSIGAIVLTGNERAFAAGADIKEMKDNTFASNYKTNFLQHWTFITRIQKPVIAAVNGFALGGGCELAMMCDIIYAGDKAVFGQPEIKLGTLPGAGGSQRLTRAIGKSRAMELILTGRNFSAQEASDWGLVSKVVPAAQLVDEAVKLGEEISKLSLPCTMMCKEAVNKAYELSLAEGLNFERRLFQASFSLNDQKEGMAAFAEKRKAEFKDE